MEQKLRELKERAEKEIAELKEKEEEILRVKAKYLGRKGELTELFNQLSSVLPEERPKIGKIANEIKTWIEKTLDDFLSEIKRKEKENILSTQRIDITMPGRRIPLGRLHPITKTINEIVEIFEGLGFEVVEGPEIETDYYNFEALNIPKDHPSRDMQDTFYITEDLIIRTHTSPVQIRTMETRKPPIKIIAPGTVYRRDSDISHTPMFHQIEGLAVGKNVSLADLKGTLSLFVQKLFGHHTPLRFRPSFFPFTEPSAEVDIQCVICKGEGCRLCSGSGWLEILGSGMVDPKVFEMVNYDPEEYTGFAFGLGIERIAMLIYGISDIRLFFENDMRFLEQF